MEGPEVLKIDEEGDVVLIFGGPQDSKQIHVSSHSLRQGSSVVRTMLSPRFKEGHNLTTTSSIEIPLPDDDHKAMATLCQVLHLRNDMIPLRLEVNHIFMVSVLVDKYDCAVAVKPNAQCWISEHLGTTNAAELRALFVSAYHFQHAELFERLSTEFLMQSDGMLWYSGWSLNHLCGENLVKTLRRLEARRRAVVRDAATTIETALAGQLERRQNHACVPACTNAELRFAKFTQQLTSLGLWPVEKLHGFRLERTLKTMRGLDMEEPFIPHCFGSPCDGSGKPGFKRASAQIVARAKELETQMSRICYLCVREGKSLGFNDCSHKKSTVVG